MNRQYVTAAKGRELASQLTKRDLAVLHSVVELRFMSGDQLTRWHFMDGDPVGAPRAARRALLRLVRLDVLERLPRVVGGARSGSAGFVYRLGLVGQRVAMELGWLPDRRRRRSRVPGTLFLDHALAVAELHTQLVEGDRAGRFELIELRAEPSCWRSYQGIGAQRLTLKPDSYLRLGLGDFEDSYFIELDNGTEGSRAITRQLKAYTAYHATGVEQASRGVFPKTLWLAPSVRRAEALRRCLAPLAREDRELFAVALQADALDVVGDTSGVTKTQLDSAE